MNSKYTLLYLLIFLPLYAVAQPGTVKGNVYSTDGQAVQFANVFFKDTERSTSSGREGSYILKVTAGTYTLVATALGFERTEIEVDIIRGETVYTDITMRPAVIDIGNVVIRGKSMVQTVKESSYNVVAIDAQSLHNTTMDLAHVLDRVSGIKIRETGGMGSSAQISLNGFSGRHVKIFMDGIPMEGGGSSFQINNIPVSLADRIEVYKGVVPIELGADALGGAINIVTRNSSNTYLDVSYSYGSFNTHRSNISFGHVTPRGFVAQINAYQNYSDNSYKIKTQLLDLETNTFSNEEYWFRRFHDMYRNEAVMVKFGVKDKKWASRLMFGITLSQEKDEIQNANLMKIVYGGKTSESKSISPSFNYELRDFLTERLDLSIAANYNRVRSNSTDTLARQYNWLGQYREKSSKGEGTYSLSEYDNNSAYVTANLRYRIAGKHFIAVNNVFNTYSRRMNDAAANYENSTEATFMKRTSNKNVLGLSYKYHPFERLNVSAFGKYYDLRVKGPVDVSTSNTAIYELQEKSYNTFGYGVAGTYLLNHALQLKLSFEQAYRLPTERELFGDEILETGDATLKPENSRNLNFNINYNGTFGSGHGLYAEAGFIYRDTRDYIRRQIEQRYGGAYYTNHGKVQNLGVDFEARYFFRDKFSAGGNITYQNIRNMERYSLSGQELIYYKDRMPNVPYFFANFDAAYNFINAVGRGSVLSLGYNLNYVYEFFRSWKSEGASIVIPTQFSHDLTVTLSLKNGRYNIAFEALNITNENLYDNYSLQKPGRSFSGKFRYFFFKVQDNPSDPVPKSRRHRHGHRARH